VGDVELLNIIKKIVGPHGGRRAARTPSTDPLIDYLRTLRGKEVHYIPNPGNAGDGFIAYATHVLFARFGIRPVVHRENDVLSGKLLLIGGGGNLIEGRYHHVRDVFHRNARDNLCTLLPQTISGYADEIAHEWPRIRLFCREPVSYRGLIEAGADPARVHLAQDMTFYLEDEHFSAFRQPGHGACDVLREDGESAGLVKPGPDNLDISLSWNGDLWHDARFCQAVTESLAAYLAPYAAIRTDRLHVAILSAFLGKQVRMLPGAYYKNRAVFDHSIAPRFANVRFEEPPPRSPLG